MKVCQNVNTERKGPENMKTYLFDFDGTLVDSMPTCAGVMKRILDETKTPYGSDIVKIITPLGYIGTANYYVKMGVPLSFDEIVERLGRYMIKEYSERVPAKSNVIKTLKILKERGDSLNVLTASPHVTLDPCLKRLGIFDIFDNVWSCNDFSTTKADLEIYRLVAKALKKPAEEIIFLDDNIEAAKTAKLAKMTVYGVYDDTSKEYAPQMKELCDRYIYDFSELIEE